ncbi:MAG: hypothetical protein RLZZ221_416 [Verrucomicrobiota bacterium]
MVTQREIARAAGLSQTAVSLALRNGAGVSRATVDKVRAVAQRLGYRPDPLISALMSQRQARTAAKLRAKVAFLTAFPTREGWRRSRYISDCFAGVQAACSARGYLVEPVWLFAPLIDGRRLSQILWTQNVQGLVVAPLPVENPPMDIDWQRFAAVSLDYSMWPTRCCTAWSMTTRAALTASSRRRTGAAIDARASSCAPPKTSARATAAWAPFSPRRISTRNGTLCRPSSFRRIGGTRESLRIGCGGSVPMSF